MSPVFVVNVGFSSTAIPGSMERETTVKLDLVFYPNETEGQGGRLVETFTEKCDFLVEPAKCRRSEVNGMVENVMMLKEVVSREYPLMIRSWGIGLPFEVGQYKGRRT